MCRKQQVIKNSNVIARNEVTKQSQKKRLPRYARNDNALKPGSNITYNYQFKVAVLTLSDKSSCGEREDLSGAIIKKMLKKIKATVEFYEILPDEKDLIKKRLMSYSKKTDLILTTGGTGLSPRDVTPEATLEVIDREIPGIAEAMRIEGLRKTKRSMLSRAVAGVREKTLIINLPGSPKAVKENLEVILDIIPHAVEKIKGSTEDCGR
jgi:molybdopterin adenylyltransferase